MENGLGRVRRLGLNGVRYLFSGLQHKVPDPHLSLSTLAGRVCRATGIAPTGLAGGGRRPAVVQAREGIAYLWVEVLGRSGRALGSVLGVHPQAVYKAARRGATDARRWERLLGERR